MQRDMILTRTDGTSIFVQIQWNSEYCDESGRTFPDEVLAAQCAGSLRAVTTADKVAMRDYGDSCRTCRREVSLRMMAKIANIVPVFPAGGDGVYCCAACAALTT